MKKIFFTISLILLGAVLFAGFVLAQAGQANECCKIRSDFSVKTTDGFLLEADLKDGDWVANKIDGGTPFCDTDGDGDSDTPTSGFEYQEKDWGMVCLLGTIYLITKWLFIIIMMVVTVMIIYGGFLIVTSAGDPEKAGKGKSVITYAAIGLAVALLARVIPSVLRFVIGT